MSSEKEKRQKPKYNALQNTGYMISLAWRIKEKKVIVLCLLSSLLAVSGNLINLYILPNIIAAVERRSEISELFITIAIFVGATMLCSATSSYVNSNTLYGRITVRMKIVGMVHEKSMTTSYANLDDKRFSDLFSSSRLATSNNSQATEAIWGTLSGLLTSILGFAIYTGVMSTVHPIMLLIILATTVTSYFLNNYVNGYEYRHREEEGEIFSHLEHLANRSKDLSSAKDIRIFGLRSWLEELYEKSMKAFAMFHRKAENVHIWARIADILLTFIRNGAAYVYLIYLVVSDGMSPAEFVLYLGVVGGFSGWVSGILGGMTTLHRQSLDLSTVREFLEYPEPFAFGEGEQLVAIPDKKYEIRLENVSFRYPGADKDTLSGINLTLHPGEKLAIVGLNGAGKTTLVKLICGFYDPTEGRVLLDGKDIRGYDRRDYYKLFSAVFQSFSLLAGTVAANVAQTEDNIDTELVGKCIDKAGLGDKISSLSGGIETKLCRDVYEDATMLSGGEAQRLMLARALYKNAPFIILDEPTAALDPIAESDMYKKYNEMAGGRSSVYISHRLASTRFCDRIIFIDNANIAEEGTHEELLRAKGKYAELFAVQSKYYKEECENEKEE